MDRTVPLQPGAHILCPHCRTWHPVIVGHPDGTPYTQAMLYWVCRGARYYAGQQGQTSRHITRTARAVGVAACPSVPLNL